MSNLGTRTNHQSRLSGAVGSSRRDRRHNSRSDGFQSTTVGFTATATIYDTGLSLTRFVKGDVIEVIGSPLNSRRYDVTASVVGTVAVKATGSIALTVNPTADDTMTFNGTAVTFVESDATGNEVNIGVSAAATRTALLALLQGSEDEQLVKFTFTAPSTSIVCTAATAGTAGNSLTLASSNGSNPVSAGTLSGGAAQVNDSMTVRPASIQTEAAGATIRIVRGNA